MTKLLTVACIPAFNEERTIGKVVLLAQRSVDQVLVCDDGSEDMTGDIAEKLGAKVIRHERNMGKGEALRAMFSACRSMNADVMVTLDGDGQHNPDEIPKLVGHLVDNQLDIVVGARFHGGNLEIPGYRKAGNRLLNALTVDGVTDTQSGFRAYGKHAIEVIKPAEMGMGVDSEILIDAARLGLKIAEVPITVSYGDGKTSTHNPIYHTLDVILSVMKLTSIKHPLVFYGIPGAVLFLSGVYFVIRTIQLFGQYGGINTLTMTYGLVAFAVTIIGLLTLFTAVILFTVSTIVRKA